MFCLSHGSTAGMSGSTTYKRHYRPKVLSRSSFFPDGSIARWSGSTTRVRAELITVGFSPSYKRGFSYPLNPISLARVLPLLLIFLEIAISQSLHGFLL